MNQIAKPLLLKSGLKLPHRIFPGPMEGVMSPLFCRVAEDLELVDFWMTPFLRITTGPIGKTTILNFTKRYSSSGKPVIVQLMGSDPDFMIQTAYRCQELGFAGVNFNLACPSKQVLAAQCGGALLKNHQYIRKLMSASCELSKKFSISLKIRTGVDSADELANIAKSIMHGTPDFIAVHYRTVAEGYNIACDREKRLSDAVQLFKNLPVIANGDITSGDDVKQIIEKTGSDGVMVARGWLKNPNLIRDIQSGHKSTEQESNLILAKFINAMALYSQKDPHPGDRNAIIDMVSYLWGRAHGLFNYIAHLPFKEPEKELTVERIMLLLLN